MDTLIRSLCFALGIFALEGASSLVHALVLKDIPPELVAQGVDLPWMLSRDVLLSALGGAAFALGAWWLRPAHAGRWACFALGFAFAVVLELFNWVLPNSLLAPAAPLHGVIAWSYFVAGCVLSAYLARRMKARA